MRLRIDIYEEKRLDSVSIPKKCTHPQISASTVDAVTFLNMKKKN
jgi:hypothetical protein